MRTIKVEIESPIPDATSPFGAFGSLFGAGPRIRVSTEVIVPDETEDGARQAGEEARIAVDGFIAGYTGE